MGIKKNNQNKKYYQDHKEYFKKYSRSYDKTIKGKFQIYKSRAKRFNRDFTLSYKQFEKLFSSACFYCGSLIKIGIDRKDSSKGYTPKNSVSCCFPCNRLKTKASSKNFINICIAVAKYTRLKHINYD